MNTKGLPQKYQKVLDKLYEDEYIYDMNNIDEDMKKSILDNGYTKDDYSIKYLVNSSDEYTFKVSVPFAYGDPLMVASNYLIFIDNYVKPTEFIDSDELPYDYDGNEDEYLVDKETAEEEGWISIEDIQTIEDTMEYIGM